MIGFLRARRRRARGNTAGLFFAHVRSERIGAHYRRLVAESGHLVDWKFAFNPDNRATPAVDFPYPSPQSVMPQRFRAMVRNGGVQMPAVGKNWTDAQIQALVAYTKQYAKAGGA